MTKMINRRKLLGVASAAVPLGILGSANTVRALPVGRYADTVIKRGKLITMDAARPTAEAIAISGEYILGVGSNSDLEGLIGPQTRIIDAAGIGRMQGDVSPKPGVTVRLVRDASEIVAVANFPHPCVVGALQVEGLKLFL